jgi:uncharacterized protein (TIGR03435 family)
MRASRLLALLLPLLALAQPPDRFDVAVIRPTTAAPGAGTSVDLLAGGRLRIVNEPARLLVRFAFEVQDSEIAGAPAWLDSDRYDLEAKTGRPEKIAPSQMPALIRNLLEDRFRLQAHREKREIPVYALVVAKPNARLKPAASGEVPGTATTDSHASRKTVATATSMDLLAKYLGNRLGRIVVDKTGLSGAYDFTLEWAPDQSPDSSAPSLTTALREQLGLRLESQKAPVEVLVIDRIERPSAN